MLRGGKSWFKCSATMLSLELNSSSDGKCFNFEHIFRFCAGHNWWTQENFRHG